MEGIIFRGVIGNTHNGGALRHIQFADILTEVGLSGGLDTIAARAEIDRVQVVGNNVLLADALFILQSPANLPELPAHSNVCIIVHLPQKLLGDGGTAAGVPAQEGVADRRRRPHPVHSLCSQKR